MILSKFLWYILTHEEYTEELDTEEYPFETEPADWEDNCHKLWLKCDDWCRDHGFEDIEEEILDVDLEKAFITYRKIFSFEGKYYEFIYDYSYYWDDDDKIGKELKEVHPTQKEIIVYE